MSNKKENESKQENINSEGSSVNDQVSKENQNQPEQDIPEIIAEVEKNVQEQSDLEKETRQASESIDEIKKALNAEKDRYLRLMAEFDNYKKRVSRDYERLVDSANEKLMLEMVDVHDNFDRAVRSSENADAKTLLDGLKLIFGKFESVLVKNGLEVFTAPGDPFDPQLHDALMKTANNTIPEDHVADVFEKGYKLKGKVIKHAKVIVSSGKN